MKIIGVMSKFRGAVKCTVCKQFCSKAASVCKGCNKACHDKCRQEVCCRPCNVCWSQRTRSCVCGKSLRSLGMSLPLSPKRQLPGTPPCKRKFQSTNQETMIAAPSTTIATPKNISATTIETPDKENVCNLSDIRERVPRW